MWLFSFCEQDITNFYPIFTQPGKSLCLSNSVCRVCNISPIIYAGFWPLRASCRAAAAQETFRCSLRVKRYYIVEKVSNLSAHQPTTSHVRPMRQVPLECNINIAPNGCSRLATSTQKGPFTAMLISCSRGTCLIEEEGRG